MNTYKICYPIERAIGSDEMMRRGMDAFANREIDSMPDDADHAAALLDEAGIITLDTER